MQTYIFFKCKHFFNSKLHLKNWGLCCFMFITRLQKSTWGRTHIRERESYAYHKWLFYVFVKGTWLVGLFHGFPLILRALERVHVWPPLSQPTLSSFIIYLFIIYFQLFPCYCFFHIFLFVRKLLLRCSRMPNILYF